MDGGAVEDVFDDVVVVGDRSLPGRETDYRKISLVLDAGAAAANTVSAGFTYGAAAYAGAAGGPYAAETAALGGVVG